MKVVARQTEKFKAACEKDRQTAYKESTSIKQEARPLTFEVFSLWLGYQNHSTPEGTTCQSGRREQPFVYNHGTKSLDIARHGSPFDTMVASHNHQHDWLDI